MSAGEKVVNALLDNSSTVLRNPDQDPQDPHVFGPPGSGSISQRYGSESGSGSFPFLIDVLSGLK